MSARIALCSLIRKGPTLQAHGWSPQGSRVAPQSLEPSTYCLLQLSPGRQSGSPSLRARATRVT
eukprot:6460099-Lingulodinium_polyedra.AAC.1